MKQFLYLIIGVGFFANFLVYCVKPPDYPIEPVIGFESIAPTQMLQQPFLKSGDTVYTDVLFTYTDGDGDLGFGDSTTSLIIKDTRLPALPLGYILPRVDPKGAGNGISGTIRVRIPVSCCIPDPIDGIPLPACDTLSPSLQLRDTVIYSIQIKDRAGHFSNVINATPVILICRR